MAGIAGMTAPERREEVSRMLDTIAHRGTEARAVVTCPNGTLGAVGSKPQPGACEARAGTITAQDASGPGRLAQAELNPRGVLLTRDPIGIAPLYYGHTADSTLAFASEVKALLAVTRDVHELSPGCRYDGRDETQYFKLQGAEPIHDTPEMIALELRRQLTTVVEGCLQASHGCEIGSWLSGGIDSSAMAALARPLQNRLATFAAGVAGAPDLEYARGVAEFLDTDHHEVVVKRDDMLKVLPEVIYHLESFDALLVRSSVTNFLVARAAADHVPAVFSGEGGDELFAGYDYLRSIRTRDLPAELIDITGRLHNTALQRVDRSAAAHGLLAHVPFLDPSVVSYALSIPAEYKLRDGVEKWILRQALAGTLPESVLTRKKAKFWEGAGVGEQLAAYAEAQVSDTDFCRERRLPNGWELNTKEELMYSRIFREHFGTFDDLSWMGRTKGAPQATLA